MYSKMIVDSLGFPQLKSFSDFSKALSISNASLYSLINRKNNYYKTITIPKKNGDPRILHAPSFSMKVVQRWIYEEILKKVSVSPSAMAFVEHKNGLLDSANKHKNNMYLLHIDIQDFFDSINKERVRKLFYGLGYNSVIVFLLSELCTLDDKLPQGAVTSPALANLICYRLDARLSGLCKKRDVAYTRYADDMCFSAKDRVTLLKLYPIVLRIVSDEDFVVNERKTHYCSYTRRMSLLGLTINDQSVHVEYERKRKLRAKIYNSIVTGNYSNRLQIIGTISYIQSIEPNYKARVIKYISKIIQKEIVTSNKNLVDAYNKNKFYASLPDCVYSGKYD